MGAGEIALVVGASGGMVATAWAFTRFLNWILPEDEA